MTPGRVEQQRAPAAVPEGGELVREETFQGWLSATAHLLWHLSPTQPESVKADDFKRHLDDEVLVGYH